MSPRTGRPPKEITKAIKLQIRITAKTAETLQACADAKQVTRTEIIEEGIELVKREIEKTP